MSDPEHGEPTPQADLRAFVEEVLRSGLMLTDLLGSLLESLPKDAFAGEPAAEVLIGMLAETLRPAADALGAQVVRQATGLVGALSDRTVADLRAAGDLPRRD